jgi:deoxyribodipyrimidine photolyase-related protein
VAVRLLTLIGHLLAAHHGIICLGTCDDGVRDVVTVWVLGDQLNRTLGALGAARPGTHRVLMVESRAKLASQRWHRQRAHLVITAMRRIAAELTSEGFEVDYRRADSLAAGVAAHRAEHQPVHVVATEPASWDGRELLRRLEVELVRTDQFLCHPDDFAAWASSRRSLKMEDFYRWQRRRLGYLMDGDEPSCGRWNFDAENRERPPRDGRSWPEPIRTELDGLDRQVLAELPETCWGADPDGTWATSRAEARRRLRHAIDEVLPRFGPHEDAMLSSSWHLAHTLLSPYLNLGLLHPKEVCDEVEAAYRAGAVPIASAEGLLRQIIGWREYVWGVYWLWMPDYRQLDALAASRPLPPLFLGAPTRMRCVEHALAGVHDHAWVHHIQRLMVLGNLCLLAGVRPRDLVAWMWSSFIDGAEWVMLPNVVGMALHADGGRMATKPYAAGGAYIDRMSDYCAGCPYDRTRRTGADACPFTTLYWDFLARHADRFARNPRVAQQVRAAQRLTDLDTVRVRAAEVLERLDRADL